MKNTRRKFTAEFKTKVPIEAIKERQSLSELAERFELHPNQISQWNGEFMENATLVFSKGKDEEQEPKVDVDKLYSKIGQLEIERDFLKKSLHKLDRMK